MSKFKFLCKASILVFVVSCLPPKMKDTNRPASTTTWDAITANAQKAGYQSERKDEGARDGKYFWFVKVMAGGGTIFYTKNNSSGQVAFACDGVSDCDKTGLALINGQ